MRFVDEAEVEVTAGHGGPGAVTFRRESKVARGGPDGGDGGRGGDVVFVADSRMSTLLDQRFKRVYEAKNGEPGDRSKRSGLAGDALRIVLPVGTVVIDAETGDVAADLSTEGAEATVAVGGQGGKGNAFFATSTRQTPRFAQPGLPGQTRHLRLSLKLMADIGLLGLPNAGKSTFLRAVTRSRAKVGAYPFTTLVPNLGVMQLGDQDIVIADIPGLVEGAHQGQGLGDRFLKHLERTRSLIHLLSLSADSVDPLEAYQTINKELEAYSEQLAALPQVVVLNKADLVDDDEITMWTEGFEELGVTVMSCSALTENGVRDVVVAASKHIDFSAPEVDESAPEKETWSPI